MKVILFFCHVHISYTHRKNYTSDTFDANNKAEEIDPYPVQITVHKYSIVDNREISSNGQFSLYTMFQLYQMIITSKGGLSAYSFVKMCSSQAFECSGRVKTSRSTRKPLQRTLRNVSTQISMCSPRRLIRADTFRLREIEV